MHRVDTMGAYRVPVVGADKGEGMKIKTAYLFSKSKYTYRSGEPAQITGVFLVTPEGSYERPCFQLTFENGEIDYIPMNDPDNIYAIIDALTAAKYSQKSQKKG